MAKRKRRRRARGKVAIKEKAELRKKSESPRQDTIPQQRFDTIPTQMPRTNGMIFKLKVRKK